MPQPWHRLRSRRGRNFPGSAETGGDRLSMETAFCGQSWLHAPQPVQRLAWKRSSASKRWLSGLWHQEQESGQPLKKTVVRMPSPSWMEYFWILNIKGLPIPANSSHNFSTLIVLHSFLGCQERNGGRGECGGITGERLEIAVAEGTVTGYNNRKRLRIHKAGYRLRGAAT